MALYKMSEPLVNHKKKKKIQNREQREILKAKEKAMKKKQKTQRRFTRKVI